MTALEPTLIPPHAPDCIDRPAILAALRERFGEDFDPGQVAGIAIFSGYSTDSVGYHGPVAVVLWAGSPDLVTSLILFEGRWLACDQPTRMICEPPVNPSVIEFQKRLAFEDQLREDEAARFRREGLL